MAGCSVTGGGGGERVAMERRTGANLTRLGAGAKIRRGKEIKGRESKEEKEEKSHSIAGTVLGEC